MRVDPVGVCIYCGVAENLTDEHIVPFGLGGGFVLPEASCTACAAVTSAVELRVLRGFMQEGRVVGKLPTRRKRDRPKSLPLQLERFGVYREVILNPSEHPGLLMLPLLAPPTGLGRSPRTPGVHVRGIETLRFGPEPTQVLFRQGATGLRASVNLDVTSFVRMLAKIGVGIAVARLGPIPPEEILVRDLILNGGDDHGSDWVGSPALSAPILGVKLYHRASLEWRPDPEDSGARLLVASVTLFAQSGASGYAVVVRREQVPWRRRAVGTEPVIIVPGAED